MINANTARGAVLCLTLSAMGTAAAQPAETELSGSVQYVDAAAGSLVVNDFAVAVSDATPISNANGATVALDDLQVGDGVSVFIARGAGQSIIVTRIERLSSGGGSND